MNDWQRLELYKEHIEDLHREAEQARRLNDAGGGSRPPVGCWLVIAALLMGLSAWWML